MRAKLGEDDPKYRCEIFYKGNDVTTLRWLTEIKLFLKPYADLIDLTFQSSYSNYILLNDKKIEFHDLDKTINETLKVLTI